MRERDEQESWIYFIVSFGKVKLKKEQGLVRLFGISNGFMSEIDSILYVVHREKDRLIRGNNFHEFRLESYM